MVTKRKYVITSIHPVIDPLTIIPQSSRVSYKTLLSFAGGVVAAVVLAVSTALCPAPVGSAACCAGVGPVGVQGTRFPLLSRIWHGVFVGVVATCPEYGK